MTFLKIIFSLNLALLALDHLYTGSLALFFPSYAIKIYQRIFGATIPDTKEYTTILKPWGALGVFAGLIGILPIIDPEKYALILVGLIILLLTRLFYRISFQIDSGKFYKLSKQRNLFHVGLIAVCLTLIAIEVFIII